MKTEIWRSQMDFVAQTVGRDTGMFPASSPDLDPPTLIEQHTSSLVPTAITIRGSNAPSYEMASFGITEDPELEERKKRGMVFGIGVAIFMAIAAVIIARAPSEPAPAPKVDKPAPVAAAPPPPAASSALPPPAAPPASASAEASADKPKDGPKAEKAARSRHRRKAK